MTHRPLHSWVDADEIRGRLGVLREKADRIVAYNRTLDPALLDEKQVATMARYGRVVGRDGFPLQVLRKVGYSIDYLTSRLSLIEADAVYAQRLKRYQRDRAGISVARPGTAKRSVFRRILRRAA